MAKYSEEIVTRICDLLATGDHKISDVCKQVGISEPTYYEWKESKPKFLEALKEAEKKRLEAFKNMARSGLAKLLDVHEYDEETIEYIDNPKDPGKPKIKSKKIVRKKIMPNPTAVIFALTNQDSENFKHKQHVDHTTGGQKIDLSVFTTDELIKRAEAVAKLSE